MIQENNHCDSKRIKCLFSFTVTLKELNAFFLSSYLGPGRAALIICISYSDCGLMSLPVTCTTEPSFFCFPYFESLYGPCSALK